MDDELRRELRALTEAAEERGDRRPAIERVGRELERCAPGDWLTLACPLADLLVEDGDCRPAADLYEEILGRMASGHPREVSLRNKMVAGLLRLDEESEDDVLLHRAARVGRAPTSDRATPAEGAGLHDLLARVYLRRFERSGDPDDHRACVAAAEAASVVEALAVDATLVAAAADELRHLGTAEPEAWRDAHRRLTALEPPAPGTTFRYEWLTRSDRVHRLLAQGESDAQLLEQALLYLEAAVHEAPTEQDRTTACGNLAGGLWKRFDSSAGGRRRDDLSDLDRCLSLLEEVLAVSPEDGADTAQWHANLPTPCGPPLSCGRSAGTISGGRWRTGGRRVPLLTHDRVTS